ncbi:hypothetical protein U6G28_02110 [Actinomycetaceae bacterium MB13-C1-2]|nr:hypothetical protein U6G28_02110 [Actinomycetaceae bacterium MB13-C1-2]
MKVSYEMEALEVLDWVFLVAALVAIIAQFKATSYSAYRGFSIAFWLLIAACFVINGLDSNSFWKWAWFAAAVGSVVEAFVFRAPKRLAFQDDK